jgi:glyoxylase-like metal-dependent hydrolase (beta-lactamase superfamily II)
LPFFPRARYIASVVDWQFVADRQESRAVFAEKLAPLVRFGVLDLVECRGAEIAPRLSVFGTAGHTPGHMSLRVHGDNRDALVIGDVCVHPVQLNDPGIAYAFEEDVLLARQTRRALLEQVSDSEVLVAAGHFPDAVGRVVRNDRGFQWVSVTT